MQDTRVRDLRPLLPPAILLEEVPVSASGLSFVQRKRDEIKAVLDGKDDRLVAIVGPCSIHDTVAAIEYAKELKKWDATFEKDLVIIMRVYFEKPRTTVGWKGLLNDPNLDGTYQINKGLRIGRKLMVDLTEMGVACAVEFLDTISPQFISDLVAWGAIGARTTESQVHRQLASGVSMPVGFKNGTSGDIGIAANAIVSAAAEHCFLGVTKEGGAAIITTSGNPDCHIILRGATTGPNYGPEHVAKVKELLAKHKVAPRIMIDCSHDNASKKHENQVIVCKSIAEQISQGDSALMGVMVESNINEGRQDLKDGKNLKYGVSITDACVDLATTEKILSELAQAVQARRAHNRK